MSKAGDIYYGFLNRIHERKERKIIKKVIKSFISDGTNDHVEGIENIKAYYKNGGMSPFPYGLESNYVDMEIKIHLNPEKGLKFINHNGRKLYFPKNFSELKISRLYKGLVVEQDIKSPHCYNQNNFNIVHENILVDVGCADAMFSLDHIEKVDKLVLFETNEFWIEALNATFEPWKEKVKIVNAFVSDQTIDNNIRLDDFFENNLKHQRIFLKMDVEGSELKVLNGAKSFLESENKIRIAIASYHNQNDFSILSNRLQESNFNTKSTDGYILFYYDRAICSPFLRRCIIQAEKK